MRYLLAALLLASPAAAQVTCWKNYEQTFCSDGRSAIQSDDYTFWSDGTTVYRPGYGDQIFITRPDPPTTPPWQPTSPDSWRPHPRERR